MSAADAPSSPMADPLSISAAAAEAGEQPGLIAHQGQQGRVYTFAELGERAAAHALDASPAVIVAERDLSTALALYAALERRVPAILVHPRATPAERARMLELCRDLRPDPELAAVLFTSGSSGRPKAVLLDRRAFVASAAASAHNLGWRPGDRWLCCLPLAHVGGLSILTRCLIARQCAVLDHAGPGVRFDPERVAALIARERVTLVSLVPTMLQALLDAGWTAPPHLRAVLLGGARASAALIERAWTRRVPILLTYGMTETCSQICTQTPGTEPRAGLVGPPLPGVELRILGDRIQVRGPMLLRGYLGADAPLDPHGWLDTGDRGRMDAHGLHVLGRGDHTIITGGENVDPGEVEAALEAHPAVRQACVFAVPDPTWGQLVAAAVVCDSALPEDLASFVAARLATYKRPRLICALPELPLGPTHKIDRARTEARAAELLAPLDYRRGPA